MEYKLTIFGNNVYQEVELEENTEGAVGIGTDLWFER